MVAGSSPAPGVKSDWGVGYDKINAMMNRLEEVPERIPTPEEVLGVMKQMANGEIRETKRLIDEEGKLS